MGKFTTYDSFEDAQTMRGVLEQMAYAQRRQHRVTAKVRKMHAQMATQRQKSYSSTKAMQHLSSLRSLDEIRSGITRRKRKATVHARLPAFRMRPSTLPNAQQMPTLPQQHPLTKIYMPKLANISVEARARTPLQPLQRSVPKVPSQPLLPTAPPVAPGLKATATWTPIAPTADAEVENQLLHGIMSSLYDENKGSFSIMYNACNIHLNL